MHKSISRRIVCALRLVVQSNLTPDGAKVGGVDLGSLLGSLYEDSAAPMAMRQYPQPQIRSTTLEEIIRPFQENLKRTSSSIVVRRLNLGVVVWATIGVALWTCVALRKQRTDYRCSAFTVINYLSKRTELFLVVFY